MEQGMIFAAGYGERLKLITKHIPKPLLFAGRERLLDGLAQIFIDYGIKNLVINTHHLRDILIPYIRDKYGERVQISDESDEKFETGGGLKNALKFFDKTKPILAVNGDIILRGEKILERLYEKYLCYNKPKILLLLVKFDDVIGGKPKKADFCFDNKTGYISYCENPDYVFTGLQIINPVIFDEIDERVFSMNHFYKKFAGSKDIMAVELNDINFYHISDLESLEIVNKALDE